MKIALWIVGGLVAYGILSLIISRIHYQLKLTQNIRQSYNMLPNLQDSLIAGFLWPVMIFVVLAWILGDLGEKVITYETKKKKTLRNLVGEKDGR